MLRMQVPEGKPLAGMVHHKGHDIAWTALGMFPHEDKMARVLKPPSTAATLNVAAVAAQAARLFRGIDEAFSKKCLVAAERAYAAAQAHPKTFAPASDSEGGGPYDDGYVADEFYWAAAELFVTTGKPNYKKDLLASKHAKELMGQRGTDSLMSWQVTDGLGTISLAIAKHSDAALQKAARAQIVAVAGHYLEAADSQGYRAPFKPSSGGYPWGSNSFVLNNMLVLALAHDFTHDEKYRAAVIDGAGYLFGVNALDQSYVTGYGERPLEHPHHRFWSKQANDKFPEPPPGVVSGGPNSGVEDPYAQAAGLRGCAPAKCFIDHIESWSTNEITINWNAPFAWVMAWLDDTKK
jgi:endoglucanase